MLKESLPNEWSYELAEEVVRDSSDRRNHRLEQQGKRKMWRKDLADTINATNEQLGIDLHWEHRSFKEQGIDREPTAGQTEICQ